MKIEVTLQGTSPLLMHNPQLVDPDFEITRQIAALTKKKNKTEDDRRQIEKLEWYGGLYTAPNGSSGLAIVQPSSKVRKCLVETARISKSGKMIERAITFSDLFVPLVYEGPKDIDKVFADRRFMSRLSVGVMGKRVMRVRPQFYPWALTLRGLFVEDAGLEWDALKRFVELAGVVGGIGDNRANGYGRFVGSVKEVK